MNREALDPHMSNWNAMAELDPLWAILSDPEKKFGKWSAEEFFRDGDREARRVVGMCDANGVSVLYGKMLDFGCEVGRMRRAFSQFFSTSVGSMFRGKWWSLRGNSTQIDRSVSLLPAPVPSCRLKTQPLTLFSPFSCFNTFQRKA